MAFLPSAAILAKANSLLAQSWAPEAIAVGRHAVYLWCAKGLIESKLWKAFERVTGGASTTRNWTTVLNLEAAARAVKPS